MLISSIISQSDVQLEVIHQISIMLMISLPVDHGSNKMSQVPGPAAATLKPVQFRNLLHRVKHRRLVGSCEWLIKKIYTSYSLCVHVLWQNFGYTSENAIVINEWFHTYTNPIDIVDPRCWCHNSNLIFIATVSFSSRPFVTIFIPQRH